MIGSTICCLYPGDKVQVPRYGTTFVKFSNQNRARGWSRLITNGTWVILFRPFTSQKLLTSPKEHMMKPPHPKKSPHLPTNIFLRTQTNFRGVMSQHWQPLWWTIPFMTCRSTPISYIYIYMCIYFCICLFTCLHGYLYLSIFYWAFISRLYICICTCKYTIHT